MALTNFSDYVTRITASWLNNVDVLLDTVFEQAATKADARSALGVYAVYLENYDAVGDGVEDDAAAVQSAIDSGAKYIYGKQGATYLLGSAGLQFASLTGVKFIGNGAKLKFNAAATQTITGGNSTMILMTSCTDCEISGWEIDGNSKATNAIGLYSNTECKVRDNRIYSSGANAQIFGTNNTRCTYAFNTVYSSYSTARGIWAGNLGGASQYEIDPLITGNVVRNNGATGIVVTADGGRVSGNHSESNAGSGIIVSGSTTFEAKRVIISGNVTRSNTGHGIQSDISPSGLTVNSTDIVVSGNICDLNTSAGIYAAYAKRWTIIGNTCKDNGTSGIQCGPITDSTIIGNNCYDTRSGGSRTQVDGIVVVAQNASLDCKNITITGNTAVNNTTYGILTTTSGSGTIGNVTIGGNTCTDNAYNIFVAGTSSYQVTVVGNTLENGGTTDLRVDPLEVTMYGNLYRTATSGLYYSFTDADTTPSVKGGRQTFRCANTGATTVTNFDDGVEGQRFTVWFTNGNTTISQGTIQLKGATNATPAADNYMTFERQASVWREVSRSF